MSHDVESIIQQDVNLFQPEFHPKKEYMTIWHSGVCIVFAMIIFAALGWQQKNTLTSLQEKVVKLSEKEHAISEEILRVSAAQRKKLGGGINDEDIILKEADLIARRALLESLVGEEQGTTEGFSEYLAALSRQHIKGSWLTGIAIERGGQEIAVAGNVLNPKIAPQYLINLSKEDIFKGKKFNVLEINTRTIEVQENKLLADDLSFLIKTKEESGNEIVEVLDES